MFHAFIDESGDDGFAPKSSRWLILGAYIIRESEIPSVKSTLASGISQIWKSSVPSHVHFVSCPHQKRKALLHLVKGIDLSCMFVMAHKGSLTPDEVKRLKCPSLYCYIAKYLVERVSWYARDRHETVRITFAERNQISINKLKNYFFEVLKNRAYPVHDIAFENVASMNAVPANTNSLVQAADWMTGGIAAGLNPDIYGNLEFSYAEILWGKYWVRNGKLWSYGIKAIPKIAHEEKLFVRINTWLEDPTTLG